MALQPGEQRHVADTGLRAGIDDHLHLFAQEARIDEDELAVAIARGDDDRVRIRIFRALPRRHHLHLVLLEIEQHAAGLQAVDAEHAVRAQVRFIQRRRLDLLHLGAGQLDRRDDHGIDLAGAADRDEVQHLALGQVQPGGELAGDHRAFGAGIDHERHRFRSSDLDLHGHAIGAVAAQRDVLIGGGRRFRRGSCRARGQRHAEHPRQHTSTPQPVIGRFYAISGAHPILNRRVAVPRP